MNEVIKSIRDRAKNKAAVYPVSHVTGKLLQILISLSNAEKILEIGLGYGTSAIYIASALPRSGRLDSIDISPNNTAVAANYIGKAGLSSKVNIRKGNARTLLEELPGLYDGVFLDFEVEYYRECLEEVIRLTKPGGFILAENIWDEATAFKIGGLHAVESIDLYRRCVYGHEELESCEMNECILTLKTKKSETKSTNYLNYAI